MRTARHLLLALLLLAAPLPALAVEVKVVVEGVTGAVRDNVLAFLSIAHEAAERDLTAARARRLHAQAPEEIRRALQPFGYYRPQIQSDLTPADTTLTVRYRIDPGQPIPLADLDLQITGAGSEDPAFRALLADFPLRAGAPLNHADYEAAKRALQDLATERGYLEATMPRHQVLIDLQRYEARAAIHLDTGPRFRLGPVSFEKTDLNPRFLQRFVPFEPGEPYSAARLFELQNALADSDYFRRVDVDPQPEQAGDDLQIPISVQLEEQRRNRYTFGIGYGTDTGARGSAGWLRRRVNRQGHRLGAEAEVSEIENRLTARYIVPLRRPLTDQFFVTASWLDEHTATRENRTALLAASLTRLRRNWQETLSLNFQYEDFEVGSDTGVTTLLYPEAGWRRVVADDPIYTTRGWGLNFNLRGTPAALGPDESFLQARAQGKWIHPVGARNRLIARADLGYTLIDDITGLPASLRFYAGGDQSVRGYKYNGLGPRDAEGEIIGGKYLVAASLEYEQHLRDRWSAAVFFDTGNALDDLSGALEQGAGVGIRWRSPIGLIRVDVASALTESGNPLRLHIVIGPDL